MSPESSKFATPRITDVVEGPIPPRVDNSLDWPGVIHTNVAEAIAAIGKPPPWGFALARDEVTTPLFMNSPAGEGNHHHVHDAFDEWWIILSGVTEFHLTGGQVFKAQVGDICWVPRGTAHHVIATDGKPSIRLAVIMTGGGQVEAISCELCGKEWDEANSRVVENEFVEITDVVSGPIPPRKDDRVWPGVLQTRPTDLFAEKGPAPWTLNVISDERNTCDLMALSAGSSTDPHFHSNYDEWWYVCAGNVEWHLIGGKVVTAGKNDLVWVPRGTGHHMVNVSEEDSLVFRASLQGGSSKAVDGCEVCDG